MFQDNPLLAQLKQQLHSQTPRAEGVVKATEKGFGFLEVDAQKSYFIPPPQMKKVMHGDRIIAVIHSEKERESAEPEELVEPFLTRFVGKVQGKNDRLAIVPDHPLLKDAIPCRAARGLNHEFKEGDWAVAEMRRHPLKGDRSFYAELTQYITFGDDHFVPWWVTLARHNLEKEAPDGVATEMLDEGLVREDLTALDFVTIDSASTEDMDDALFAKALPDDKLQLIVAIADPTAWMLDIVAEPRRIANRIVEEAMIAANICAARVLRDKLGFGIYNVHMGFDPANADALAALLKTHGLHVDAEEVLTLDGFCKLRRELDAQPTGFLDSRIRRFQSFAEISTEPGPHFGLGLEAYATWTSPIRKYGDMINHRLLKAVIKGETATRPQDEITVQMAERRRLNRMAERDVGDWLYARFLKDKAGTDTRFAAEIVDISRGGMRVRLVDNGAIAFIPAPFLHAVRDELVCSQENGTVQIKGETVYKVTDVIDVTIAEVRMETRSIIARPVA